MKLKDCKVGDEITVYLTPGLSLIYNDYVQQVRDACVGLATLLIKVDTVDADEPFFCAIQKNPANLYPSYMGNIGGSASVFDYITRAGGDPNDYWCSGWLKHNTYFTVGTAASVVVVPGGMNCASRFCNELNVYAQPNTPDGKYYCRSCRQRPMSMR